MALLLLSPRGKFAVSQKYDGVDDAGAVRAIDFPWFSFVLCCTGLQATSHGYDRGSSGGKSVGIFKVTGIRISRFSLKE